MRLYQAALLTPLVLVLAAGASLAQEPPPSELEQPRDAYRQAFSAWESGDPKLEEELLTAEPDSVLKRINEARTRRAALLQAKGAYLKALRLRFSADLQQLRGGSFAPPRPEDAVTAHKKVLAEVAATYQKTSERLDQPNLAPALSTALRRQREDLADLQNLYLQQQQRLEKLTTDQQDYLLQRTSLIENTERLMRLSGYRESLIPDQLTLWNRYYDTLARYIQSMGPRPYTGAVLSFSGAWTWSASEQERAPDYASESVEMKITETGDALRGTFVSHIHVPAGKKEKPVVSFEFSGQRTGNTAVLQFTGAKGAKGTLQLMLRPEGMSFEWTATQTGGLDFSNGTSFGRPILRRSAEPQAAPAVVETAAAPASAPAPAPQTPPVTTTVPEPATPEPPVTAPLAFSGAWAWTASDKQRTADYANERVELKIDQKGDSIRGSFRCRVTIPAGKPENPVISFEFRGKRTGNTAALQWTGPAGAKGTLQLTLSAEGMAFDWKATQTGALDFASGSSFGRPLLHRVGN